MSDSSVDLDDMMWGESDRRCEAEEKRIRDEEKRRLRDPVGFDKEKNLDSEWETKKRRFGSSYSSRQEEEEAKRFNQLQKERKKARGKLSDRQRIAMLELFCEKLCRKLIDKNVLGYETSVLEYSAFNNRSACKSGFQGYIEEEENED